MPKIVPLLSVKYSIIFRVIGNLMITDNERGFYWIYEKVIQVHR